MSERATAACTMTEEALLRLFFLLAASGLWLTWQGEKAGG